MSVVRPHRMVDLGATRPFGLALIDWRVIGDLELSGLMLALTLCDRSWA